MTDLNFVPTLKIFSLLKKTGGGGGGGGVTSVTLISMVVGSTLAITQDGNTSST